MEKCEKCGRITNSVYFEEDGANICSGCYFEAEDELYGDDDAGGTGHGDISHSDADPGL